MVADNVILLLSKLYNNNSVAEVIVANNAKECPTMLPQHQLLLATLRIKYDKLKIQLQTPQQAVDSRDQQNNSQIFSYISAACRDQTILKNESNIQEHMTSKLLQMHHVPDTGIDLLSNGNLLPQHIIEALNPNASMVFAGKTMTNLLPNYRLRFVDNISAETSSVANEAYKKLTACQDEAFVDENDITLLLCEIAIAQQDDDIESHKDWAKLVAMMQSATLNKVNKYATKTNDYQQFTTFGMLQSGTKIFFLEMEAVTTDVPLNRNQKQQKQQQQQHQGEQPEKALSFELKTSKCFDIESQLKLIDAHIAYMMQVCKQNSETMKAASYNTANFALPIIEASTILQLPNRVTTLCHDNIKVHDLKNVSDEELQNTIDESCETYSSTESSNINVLPMIEQDFVESALKHKHKSFNSLAHDSTVYGVQVLRGAKDRVILKHGNPCLLFYLQKDELQWLILSDNSVNQQSESKNYNLDKNTTVGAQLQEEILHKAIMKSRSFSNCQFENTLFATMQLVLIAKCNFLMDVVKSSNKCCKTIVVSGLYRGDSDEKRACLKIVPEKQSLNGPTGVVHLEDYLLDGFWYTYNHRFSMHHVPRYYGIVSSPLFNYDQWKMLFDNSSQTNPIVQQQQESFSPPATSLAIIIEHLESIDEIVTIMLSKNKFQRLYLFHAIVKEMNDALDQFQKIKLIHGDISWGNVMFRKTTCVVKSSNDKDCGYENEDCFTAVLIDLDKASFQEGRCNQCTPYYFHDNYYISSLENDKFAMACVIARFYLLCLTGSKYFHNKKIQPEEDVQMLIQFIEESKAPAPLPSLQEEVDGYLLLNSLLGKKPVQPQFEWDSFLHKKMQQVLLPMFGTLAFLTKRASKAALK